ncbi:uncharacterized protein LOC126854731 isoform X2 [Cataglyphis hispanica]|uniref:uncharacterized protein LOC126854731 isoform X2 n=1 Tax=Cataglyphis hispanica TaxID=1086592 RepID=UPI00217F8C61|nr:uncharacterized protein LOC126854731 isoform X2 [Cataglyphis hispanica]
MVRRKSVPRSIATPEPGETESNRTNVIVNKRKRKSRVLQEIKHLRRTTHFLIPKLPFSRLIREIMIDLFPRQEINRTNLQDTSFCPRSFTRGNRDVYCTILRGCIAVGIAC